MAAGERWRRAAEAALVLLFGAGAQLLRSRAVAPYMDEPFHVGQTQRYCRGELGAWDPKITTLPGLYCFGAGWGWLAGRAPGAWGLGPLCNHHVLRLAQLPLHALAYRAAAGLAQRLHGSVGWLAVLVALLPTHAFFAFLYYTDTGSLAFCLLTHLAALEGRYARAACAAALAILFRQTNAVWAAFSLGAALLQESAAAQRGREPPHAAPTSAGPGDRKGGSRSGTAQREDTDGLRQRERVDEQDSRGAGGQEGSVPAAASGPPEAGRTEQQGLWRELRGLLVFLQQDWRGVLGRTWPLLAALAAFCAFVAVNGGIVVGDRAHHTPVAHLMQPLYLLGAICAASAPTHFAPDRVARAARSLQAAAQRRPLATAGLLAAASAGVGLCIRHGTLAHPFVLADNRHYTFYLWKDVLARPWLRYGLLPVYLYCGWSAWEGLRRGGTGPLWVLGLLACACAALVPAWLLEVRYFTTPLVLVLLHSQPPTQGQGAATAGAFLLLNAALLAVFVLRPFRWPDGSVARFMW